MKKLTLALTVALSATQATAIKSNTQIGDCVVSGYVFNYEIVQKVDKNIYYMVGNWMSRHAALQTKKARFNSRGQMNMPIQFLGTKQIDVGDGFATDVDFWKECDASKLEEMRVNDMIKEGRRMK